MTQDGEARKKMRSGEEPVVESRERPSMPSRPEIGGAAEAEEAGGARMAPTDELGGGKGREEPSAGQKRGPEAREAEQEGERMDPHEEARSERARARAPRGDQEPPGEQETEPPGDGDEGYVRMRVVGSEGQWRVEGTEEVSGPLAVPNRLRHGWAWEVRCGGERLGLGLVPDLGETRGFPDPEGRPGMDGHHITEPGEMRFVVRIPAAVMRDLEVEELEIDLYRVEDPPAEKVGPGPLGEQFPDRVARVSAGPRSK